MTIAAQEATVDEVVAAAPEGWRTITVNLEIDEVDGEVVLSPMAHYHLGGTAHELRLGIDATDSFEELRNAMAAADPAQRAWTVCHLHIDDDGRYDFRFGYGATPRLDTLRQ